MFSGFMAAFTTRPVIQGTRGVVASGHYLASTAGFRMLENGGNAFDAGVATVFCLNLLEPHNCGIGGEVPVLLFSAKDRKVHAVSGQGSAPREMTIAWFRRNGVNLIPGDGLLPAMVPAVVGTLTEVLARFGTMRLADVLQPALELAEEGFPMYPDLRAQLVANAERFRERYPETARLYLSADGDPLPVGELQSNEAWAEMLRRMLEAEARSPVRNRVAGIEAGRDEFYRGETAARLAAYLATATVPDSSGLANKGFLTRADLGAWGARVEEPVRYTYRGVEVCKCPPWTQGPVFLQQLALLEGFDLKSMGHNAPEYLHTLIECAKLAFADREAHYGDPEFDKVPLASMLGKDYTQARRALVGAEASAEIRPGKPAGAVGPEAIADIRSVEADNADTGVHARDTTHCDVVDRWGNMIALTPSGGWVQSSPVVPGLGFPLGTRGQMFYLNQERPNALAPGKRPRTTLTPSLALKEGRPWMVFGTPGGDQQDQWTLQYFLNVVEFGMDLQEAIDAPTVHTLHVPSSFHPRGARPNVMVAEGRVPGETIAALEAKGHVVERTADWANGRVMGVRLRANGVIEGAASPRSMMAYAVGW